jgi:hypothetical protein
LLILQPYAHSSFSAAFLRWATLDAALLH